MKTFEITMIGERRKKIIKADSYGESPPIGQFYKQRIPFIKFWKVIDGGQETVAMINAGAIKLIVVK